MSEQYILYKVENDEEKYVYDHCSIFGISFTYDIQDALKFSLEKAQKLANKENLLIKQCMG
jgi:hypothetical protein